MESPSQSLHRPQQWPAPSHVPVLGSVLDPHGVPAGSGTSTQPTVASQCTLTHGARSAIATMQTRAGPGTQVPATQRSLVVQAFPSLHAVPSGALALTQPLAGSHVSTVHALPSPHASGGPPAH